MITLLSVDILLLWKYLLRIGFTVTSNWALLAVVAIERKQVGTSLSGSCARSRARIPSKDGWHSTSATLKTVRVKPVQIRSHRGMVAMTWRLGVNAGKWWLKTCTDVQTVHYWTLNSMTNRFLNWLTLVCKAGNNAARKFCQVWNEKLNSDMSPTKNGGIYLCV